MLKRNILETYFNFKDLRREINKFVQHCYDNTYKFRDEENLVNLVKLSISSCQTSIFFRGVKHLKIRGTRLFDFLFFS